MSSAEMLVNLEVPWVIIGHSERRLILNESNEVCAYNFLIDPIDVFANVLLLNVDIV